ncbi:MAG: hypothetical protein E7678_05360 [Ruminococcaceae bacterium]|nr:hypothetical protein [Oscillospiraceae bacterium]
MVQTVYIDLFFLINFSMDFLALFLASKLLGCGKKLIRLVLAAIFGGFYACFSLIFPLENYLSVFSFAVDALACLIMAFIAIFKPKIRSGVISFALVFGAVSILLGGAMTALFYAFNRLGLDRAFAGEKAQSDGISVYIFAIFAAISGFLALLGGKFFKKKALRQNGTVTVEYRGKSASLLCMCDSGNLLREPISRLPCILIELDAVKKLFSNVFLECVRRGDIEKIPISESSRIRMVPAKSATGETLLVAIRPDSIKLDMGKGESFVEAYIVISTEKISAHGAKALVPSELIFGAV